MRRRVWVVTGVLGAGLVVGWCSWSGPVEAPRASSDDAPSSGTDPGGRAPAAMPAVAGRLADGGPPRTVPVGRAATTTPGPTPTLAPPADLAAAAEALAGRHATLVDALGAVVQRVDGPRRATAQAVVDEAVDALDAVWADLDRGAVGPLEAAWRQRAAVRRATDALRAEGLAAAADALVARTGGDASAPAWGEPLDADGLRDWLGPRAQPSAQAPPP